MKYLISIFLFLISFGEVFSYQIVWKRTLEENNGYYFSRNGEEIIIKKSLGFEILDRRNGNKIRANDSLRYQIFSEDFTLALIKNYDTIRVYNTTNNKLISVFIDKIDYDSNFTKYSHFIFSPDNKYIIRSFSSYGTDSSHHFKSKGWIDIIDITNAKVIKTIRGDSVEQFGYISSIFFDKTDSNLFYFAESYFDINEGDSSVSKKIFQFDLLKDELIELYSKTSIISYNFEVMDYLRISPFNPTGCSKHNDYIWTSFTVLSPFICTYDIDESIYHQFYIALNNSTLLIINKDWNNSETFDVGLYNGERYSSGNYHFGTYNSVKIYSGESKSGNVSGSVNAVNQWFLIYNPDNKELIMFADSIETNIKEKNQNFEYISFPNPASDFIEISVGANSPSPLQSDVRIYDVFGQIQTTPSLRDTPTWKGGEKVRIDVSGLATGMYFVRVGDKVSKFVKI